MTSCTPPPSDEEVESTGAGLEVKSETKTLDNFYPGGLHKSKDLQSRL